MQIHDDRVSLDVIQYTVCVLLSHLKCVQLIHCKRAPIRVNSLKWMVSKVKSWNDIVTNGVRASRCISFVYISRVHTAQSKFIVRIKNSSRYSAHKSNNSVTNK